MKKRNALKAVLKGYLLLSTIYTGVKFLQCRGLGKEDDRHLIGKAIDRIGGYEIDADEVITIDDAEMHVSYNPYLQLFTNSIGGVAIVLNGTTEVFTDDQFRKMSPPTQMAILAHEMGHYKCGHKPGITYQIDRLKAIMQNKVLPIEVEADAYACKIVGAWNMINALEELKTIQGVSKKEINLRINHIKSCIRYSVKIDNAIVIFNGLHKEVERINACDLPFPEDF